VIFFIADTSFIPARHLLAGRESCCDSRAAEKILASALSRSFATQTPRANKKGAAALRGSASGENESGAALMRRVLSSVFM
jgi:hypothetical protein